MLKSKAKQSSPFKGSQSNIKSFDSNSHLEESDVKSFLELYKENTTEFFQRVDNYNGFFTTQQIESLNYENFEEHVFFDSAIEKVNYAFDQIINFFPYDKTLFSVEQYMKNLDGFSKYVLDNKIKKNIGYFNSGNLNSGIVIKDNKGFLFDDYSKADKFKNFNLDKDIKINFWIRPKDRGADGNQFLQPGLECIFKKLYYDEANKTGFGFLIYLDDFEITSSGQGYCNIYFVLVDNRKIFKSKFKIKSGEFSNINYLIQSRIENKVVAKKFHMHVNGKEINKNSNDYEDSKNIDIIKFEDLELFLLYSKESAYICNSDIGDVSLEDDLNNTVSFNNLSKFEGFIDELRFYSGKNLNNENIQKEIKNNVYSSKNLKLNLRFNEPAGTYTNSDVVLDYSGNKLHGLIMNFNTRQTQSGLTTYDNYQRIENDILVNSPVVYELLENNPVLFSSQSHDYRQEMLEEAKIYDLENPNSFWRLFPKNIFIEGSDFDNLDQIYTNDKTKLPGDFLGIEKNVSQELVKLISIWARFFDQLKIYIDSLTEVLNVSYDTLEEQKKIDGAILPIALKKMGFNLKEIFSLPTQEKLNKKNLTREETISEYSIRQIQNILWKRLMINSKDVLMSKGTHKSIKSIFNIFGLEADRFITIKEITGQNKISINNNFFIKNKNAKIIDFNNHNQKFNQQTEYSLQSTIDGAPTNKIYFQTRLLTYEELDLSQDFLFESFIFYNKNDTEMYKDSQSIFRLNMNTGNETSFNHPFLNVVFKRKNKKSKSGNVILYFNSNQESNDGIIKKEIGNVEILNGEIYHIIFQKKYIVEKNIIEYHFELRNTSNNSYAGKSFSQTFYTQNNITSSAERKICGSLGNYRYISMIQGTTFESMSYETEFQGCLVNYRAYNNSMSDINIRLKSKDIFKIGQSSFKENPIENLIIDNNFSFHETSQHEDVKIYEFKNIISKEDLLLYPSFLSIPNGIVSEGYDPFRYEKVMILSQNSEIDKPTEHNKIYINSHDSKEKKFEYQNFMSNNITQVRPDFLYHDDLRCYIDFSCVNFLNQEISKIIDVNEYFSKVLGNSSSKFEESYVSIEKTREIFFKRLKAEVSYQPLYQIYKYFDNILEDLLYSCVPSKVNYLGFNFVYESHSLERNKYVYKNSDSRLPIINDERNKIYHYDDVLDNENAYYRQDYAIPKDDNSVELTPVADLV